MFVLLPVCNFLEQTQIGWILRVIAVIFMLWRTIVPTMEMTMWDPMARQQRKHAVPVEEAATQMPHHR